MPQHERYEQEGYISVYTRQLIELSEHLTAFEVHDIRQRLVLIIRKFIMLTHATGEHDDPEDLPGQAVGAVDVGDAVRARVHRRVLDRRLDTLTAHLLCMGALYRCRHGNTSSTQCTCVCVQNCMYILVVVDDDPRPVCTKQLVSVNIIRLMTQIVSKSMG